MEHSTTNGTHYTQAPAPIADGLRAFFANTPSVKPAEPFLQYVAMEGNVIGLRMPTGRVMLQRLLECKGNTITEYISKELGEPAEVIFLSAENTLDVLKAHAEANSTSVSAAITSTQAAAYIIEHGLGLNDIVKLYAAEKAFDTEAVTAAWRDALPIAQENEQFNKHFAGAWAGVYHLNADGERALQYILVNTWNAYREGYEAGRYEQDTPTTSPWGTPQTARHLGEGIYRVTTAAHGGIMVPKENAEEYLPHAVLNMAERHDNYLCYEEDDLAPVVERYLKEYNKALTISTGHEYYEEADADYNDGWEPPFNLN